MHRLVFESTKGHVDHQHDEVGKLGCRYITHDWYGGVVPSESPSRCSISNDINFNEKATLKEHIFQ